MKSILVLDSGVGGLSICESILHNLPDVKLIYFADDAYFPYGLLDEKILRERLDAIVGSMLQTHRPDLIVLACNTVSTLVLPDLRRKYDLPFVGVVPAIKPAVQLSKTKHIALLATPATVARQYTDDLIGEFAQGCEVMRIGSSELVVEAERYLAGRPVDEERVSGILEPISQLDVCQAKVDTLVLGCTHFPLIKEQIAKVLPGINLVDSGEAIARRVSHLLGDEEIVDSEDKATLVHQIYFSKTIPNEVVFNISLKRIGINHYQLHCFSAIMD